MYLYDLTIIDGTNYGDDCTTSLDTCVDDDTECVGGTCQCIDGFSFQSGECGKLMCFLIRDLPNVK